jgi:hypothetical protein
MSLALTKTFTEPNHMEEFLASEGNGSISREVITVASGQNLKAGQPFQLSGGKAVAATGTVNTAGAIVTPVAGILSQDCDASATGANADVPNVPYIARNAEVVDALIQYNGVGSTQKAAIKKSLKETLFIIQR